MKRKTSWYSKVHKEVETYLDYKKNQSVANRLDHLERTARRAQSMAKIIARESREAIDVEVLEIAALLHDIDETYAHTAAAIDRSIRAAEMLLTDVGYPKDKIRRIKKLISEHSSERPTKATSIESKILYDADKIDAIGALGIARLFMLAGQQGRTLREAAAYYRKKIRMALPEIRTKLGKRIVKAKLKYVNNFLARLEKEQKKLL